MGLFLQAVGVALQSLYIVDKASKNFSGLRFAVSSEYVLMSAKSFIGTLILTGL